MASVPGTFWRRHFDSRKDRASATMWVGEGGGEGRGGVRHVYSKITILFCFYFFHDSWFTVSCQFLLFSKVTQPYIYTYEYTYIFFFSHYPPSCSITNKWTNSKCWKGCEDTCFWMIYHAISQSLQTPPLTKGWISPLELLFSVLLIQIPFPWFTETRNLVICICLCLTC